MDELDGCTALISGGSRGIGHAVAVALAARGADVALLAKTDQPHPTLSGTVHSAVADVEAAGGRGLAVVGDVRDDDDVDRAVSQTVETFGGIDVVINNASAIDLSPAGSLPMRRYDLMQDINARGAYLLGAAALPHLRRSAEELRPDGPNSTGQPNSTDGAGFAPHMVTFAPPLNLDPKWFAAHLGYTMSKYAMSMTTLGFAEQLRADGVRANSLWPTTLIDTAAIRMLAEQSGEGSAMVQRARTPAVMADAAVALITGRAGHRTGQLLTDEEVLGAVGIEDFSGYAVDPTQEPMPDMFL